MIKTIEVNKIADQDLLELVRKFAKQNGDHYLLQENGKPLAVLISQQEFDRYREQERLQAAQELRKFLQEQRANLNHDYSEEEVEKDVLEAIHELRQQRRK